MKCISNLQAILETRKMAKFPPILADLNEAQLFSPLNYFGLKALQEKWLDFFSL